MPRPSTAFLHWVQALIGHEHTLREAQRLVPSLVICALPQGLALAPLTERAVHELATSELVEFDLPVSIVPGVAPGATGLAVRLSHQGPIVYAATYFDGAGGHQDALAWEEGQLLLRLSSDTSAPTSASSIGRALRRLGVVAPSGQHEFDVLGLGQHLSNDAWAAAHDAENASA